LQWKHNNKKRGGGDRRKKERKGKEKDGINIKMPPLIEGCDTCWTCKLLNTIRGSGDTINDASVAGQYISMDFGVIVQRSKDLKLYDKFLGLNGESAYLL
jgi:hypothetical protein